MLNNIIINNMEKIPYLHYSIQFNIQDIKKNNDYTDAPILKQYEDIIISIINNNTFDEFVSSINLCSINNSYISSNNRFCNFYHFILNN